MDDIITAARITEMPKEIFDPMPEVYVTINGIEERLFDYYPDEIQFRPSEFIGLTLEKAHRLKFTKDKAWLQS